MLKKWFLLILVLAALAIPAAAQNVSFSNLGLAGSQDVLLYTYNATTGSQTLLGTYNTSDSQVPIPDGDFNIVLKPSNTARYSDPLLMMTDGLGFIETYWVQLFVLVFLLAIVLGRR